MRQIFHVDIDTFFVAVERRKNHDLVGKPVIVGGAHNHRGVVTCASYEARTHRIKAGMPMTQARRLCPNGVFLQGDYRSYIQTSQAFMQILSSHSPFLQPLGIDEAFVDMTGFPSTGKTAYNLAQTIQHQILEELDVPVSVGIATSKPIAKVASALAKPYGIMEVPNKGEAAFLAPLPIRRLPGIGKVTETKLNRNYIFSIGDLANLSSTTIAKLLGKQGIYLSQVANGNDTSPVITHSDPKSISREITFGTDTDDQVYLQGCIHYLSELICRKLRDQRKWARCVFLKIRWSNFTTIQRQMILQDPCSNFSEIYDHAIQLLQTELNKRPPGRQNQVRLIGVGVTRFTNPWTQFRLPGFSGHQIPWDEAPQWEGSPVIPLERYIDLIRGKYGFTAIQKGITYRFLRSSPGDETTPYQFESGS